MKIPTNSSFHEVIDSYCRRERCNPATAMRHIVIFSLACLFGDEDRTKFLQIIKEDWPDDEIKALQDMNG